MPKDDATWLNVCYVVLGLLAAYVGWNAINTLGIQAGWVEKYDTWYPMATTFGAVVAGAAAYFWVKKDPERRDYHLSAIAELRKVTWPSWPDTKRMTLVVVVVVAIFALALTAFDFSWAWLLRQIIT